MRIVLTVRPYGCVRVTEDVSAKQCFSMCMERPEGTGEHTTSRLRGGGPLLVSLFLTPREEAISSLTLTTRDLH